MLITQQSQKLEENKHRLGIFLISDFFDVCLTKFKNNQTFLDKNYPQFLVTTRGNIPMGYITNVDLNEFIY